MATPFKCDEKVTVERRAVASDPDYGTETVTWVPVATRIWANVQDVLPKLSAESTANGLRIGVLHSRLRIRVNNAIDQTMRVKLHSKGDRVMQIIAGPAFLDDRAHMEFMLENTSS